MKNIKKQKPLLMYFIMTFILSWSGILVTSVFMGMPTTSTQFAENGPVALIPLLLGPAIIGLLLTGLTKGKTGLFELKNRLLKWKINIKWYAFAILTLPVFLTLMLLILSQISSDFIPKVFNEKDKLSFIITGILTGLIGGGLFEEIGWTGFATPEFRSRYSILKTGLILGFFWGVWHFLPVFWGSGDIDGNIEWSGFLPGLFCHYAVLIPYRIILVWLHDNTGSMIPVILMHASLTTFANFILNISKGGLSLLIYYIILAVFLWIIVGIISKSKKVNHQIN
ncbi:MAG: CPBP family intramembrane metalloprotease [Spirochaetes bacterium]|nr:CPBP family intramembrane metalloprotease [Spirochaetota bacterium]